MAISTSPVHLRIIVTPSFNMAATMGFVDPFRAINYLEGITRYSWDFVSALGGECVSSNGTSIKTKDIASLPTDRVDFLIVSSSWTPEEHGSAAVQGILRKAARQNTTIGAIDTGAFILADAGLLSRHRVTVHYEHIDAFRELFPEVNCTEALFEFDKDRISCCGGTASFDFALQIIEGIHGSTLANAAARYVFHPYMRERGAPQNPRFSEPLGAHIPETVRNAIQAMENNLEDPIPINEICKAAEISQRQLNRLFRQYLKKTPVLYYRDIRLDRARGLVTQTSLPMSEIAFACGFSSQVYFSRAYRERFDLPPIKDRIEGRIPFEFRAWPMHHRNNRNERPPDAN